MLDASYYRKTDEIISRYVREARSLIPIMQDIQAEYRYLPAELLSYVAKEIGITEAKAYSVATFYENFTQKLTLQHVAGEIGISPNHFSALFHRTVGVSFREYLCQIRVEESKRLLLYSDDSLADIASSMGFPDQSNFSKVFKRITGISPGKYRG